MQRPNCAESGRAAIGTMLIQLVVHRLVDDVFAPQAGQLITETLDVWCDLFWQEYLRHAQGWMVIATQTQPVLAARWSNRST